MNNEKKKRLSFLVTDSPLLCCHPLCQRFSLTLLLVSMTQKLTVIIDSSNYSSQLVQAFYVFNV